MSLALKETMLEKELKIVNINKDIKIGKKAKWKFLYFPVHQAQTFQ